MDLEELRDVQKTERNQDDLQPLRDSFYGDAAEYINELKRERDQVAAEVDDPFSDPKIAELTDKIETSEQIIESIYERRVGKITKRATFAAAGMAAEPDDLAEQEKILFRELINGIEQNRENTQDLLSRADRTNDSVDGPERWTEILEQHGEKLSEEVPTYRKEIHRSLFEELEEIHKRRQAIQDQSNKRFLINIILTIVSLFLAFTSVYLSYIAFF